MGAKLKSKTHLLNTFFNCFEPFFTRFASKFAKSANLNPKNFFLKKIRKDIKKRRFSRWFRIRWKSCKKCTKKSYQRKSWTNMSKKWKKAFFPSHFCYLFMVHFFITFSTDSKSAWNSAFFDTHIEFCSKKIFLLLLALFLDFDCKCAGNAQKNGKSFFMNVS